LVSDWNASADVSARISQDAQREIGSAPPGSLVIVGTPVVGSSRTHHTWLWMWALPFALEPPFVPAGLAERVALVEPPDVYCCLREQWELKTRQTIAGWASRPAAPVIVLSWDTASGALARRLDRDEPQLRQQALDLLQASSPKEMCERLDAVLGTIGNSCATS
jgi:hypothetical protein